MPTAMGVDLSLASCGLALMDKSFVLRFAATLTPAKGDALTSVEKRALILKAVRKIYYQYGGFDVLVMEPVRMFTGGKNVYLVSLEAIIGLSTTLEDWAHKLGIPVVKVYPNSWRKYILGTGKAKKKDAIKYVLNKYGRDLREDAAEAVCQAEYGVRGLKI